MNEALFELLRLGDSKQLPRVSIVNYLVTVDFGLYDLQGLMLVMIGLRML